MQKSEILSGSEFGLHGTSGTGGVSLCSVLRAVLSVTLVHLSHGGQLRLTLIQPVVWALRKGHGSPDYIQLTHPHTDARLWKQKTHKQNETDTHTWQRMGK